MIEDDEAYNAARVVKALSHPLRLQLISALDGEELSLVELSNITEENAMIISQQLRILRDEEIVQRRSIDNNPYYRVEQSDRLRSIISTLLTISSKIKYS